MDQRMLTLNVRGGARICVPRSLDHITTYVLLEQEDWFEDEIRFLRRWLRPGMRALDVGASYGVYTATIAKAVGPAGRVWSFEPTPQTARLLRRTVEQNRFTQVNVVKQAVSDRVGKVSLALNPNSEANAITAAGTAEVSQVEVGATTLDHAAASHAWGDLDFVKLDVEGAELQAIHGGHGLFANGSPLVMLEIKVGEDFDLRPLEPLTAAGYEFFRLLPGMLVLTRFEVSEPRDIYLLNLFACKRDRAERLAADGFLSMGVDRVPSAADSFADHESAYLAGLASFAESRREDVHVATRVELLNNALALVKRSLQSHATLPRTLSSARVDFELGNRNFAVKSLDEALCRLAREGKDPLAEPFLWPSETFASRGLAPSGEEGLRCAVTEQYERLRAYSSLWTGTSALDVLEPVLPSPFCSPEMERRRQLVRLRAGLQREPEAVALLSAASEDNLNPAFWRGEI